MKKVIYIASLCFASLFVSSCDDYLTLESPDQLTSGSFWRNESDAQAGISAAYSQLEYYIDTWEFAEVKWPVEAYREDIIKWVTMHVTIPTGWNSTISLIQTVTHSSAIIGGTTTKEPALPIR